MKLKPWTAISSLLLASNAHSTILTVVNTDSGLEEGTLQQAIVDANNIPGADIILFDASLTGDIKVDSSLYISDELTIDGIDAPGISIEINSEEDHLIEIKNTSLSLANLSFNSTGNDFFVYGYGDDLFFSMYNVSIGPEIGSPEAMPGEIVIIPDESTFTPNIIIDPYSEIEISSIVLESGDNPTSTGPSGLQQTLGSGDIGLNQAQSTIIITNSENVDEEPLGIEIASLSNENSGGILFTSESENTSIEVSSVVEENNNANLPESSSLGFLSTVSILSLLLYGFISFRKSS